MDVFFHPPLTSNPLPDRRKRKAWWGEGVGWAGDGRRDATDAKEGEEVEVAWKLAMIACFTVWGWGLGFVCTLFRGPVSIRLTTCGSCAIQALQVVEKQNLQTSYSNIKTKIGSYCTVYNIVGYSLKSKGNTDMRTLEVIEVTTLFIQYAYLFTITNRLSLN